MLNAPLGINGNAEPAERASFRFVSRRINIQDSTGLLAQLFVPEFVVGKCALLLMKVSKRAHIDHKSKQNDYFSSRYTYVRVKIGNRCKFPISIERNSYSFCPNTRLVATVHCYPSQIIPFRRLFRQGGLTTSVWITNGKVSFD